jgi:ubiquinone/menaquinone biosynthesis C-methylase UbiE
MAADPRLELKREVHDYWNAQSCGTEFTDEDKFSRAYFDEIEEHRYSTEPEIHAFAQFTRHAGEKVLEVGTGAGTDFTQWVRAGARAHGVDLTEEAVEHVRNRLALYGLEAEDIRVADAERLPFESGSFDLVYSWGVIHHSPDTPAAFAEIARVLRPGGTAKVMVYNRHSLLAYRLWVKHALREGKPWRSLRWVLHHHMESAGTKGYTPRELRRMLAPLPVSDVKIRPVLTWHDTLGEAGGAVHRLANAVAWLLGGNRVGLFMTIRFRRR